MTNCFEKCDHNATHKPFTDENLKQALWIKEMKDNSLYMASWWLGQAEVDNVDTFSTDHKLKHELSTYLSCAPYQKITDSLGTNEIP